MLHEPTPFLFRYLATSCLDSALELVNNEIIRLDSSMEKAGKSSFVRERVPRLIEWISPSRGHQSVLQRNQELRREPSSPPTPIAENHQRLQTEGSQRPTQCDSQ